MLPNPIRGGKHRYNDPSPSHTLHHDSGTELVSAAKCVLVVCVCVCLMDLGSLNVFNVLYLRMRS